MKKPTFFELFALLIMCVFFFVAPLLVYFAARTVQSNNNKVQDWLPADFTETGELAWFRQHFFADQFIIVSWEGCRLGGEPKANGRTGDDPRIEQLAALLVPGEENSNSPYAGYFKSVTTGRRVLNQLTAPPLNIPYEEAVQRLTGSLIGPDGQQTCLVISLTDETARNFRPIIGRGKTQLLKSRQTEGLLFEALRSVRIDPEDAYVGGPPADNVAIDEEGERTLVRLAGLSGLLGLGLAWYALKSVRMTMIVLACGLLSAALALAMVTLTGQSSDAIMLSMPALVYVLAISGAIHLINYYKEARRRGGLYGAAEQAIAHGWKPALLCSVTTALGLLSLYSSNLVPIRKFGLYAALGVMGTLIVLFAFLPSALTLWPDPLDNKPQREPGEHGRFARWRRRLGTTADRFWGRFSTSIIRHHGLVSVACFGVIGLIGWGVTDVRTNIDLMKLFDGKARIIHDYEWLEANVGRLVPMELVLRFQPEVQRSASSEGSGELFKLSLLERMETVANVQQAVQARFGLQGEDKIGPCMSALTFSPNLPEERGDTMTFLKRSTYNRKLEENRQKLLATDYLRVDPDSGDELWRISLRVAAFQDIDYGQFAHHVREVVEPLLSAQRERLQILKQLAQSRENQSYAGATICLWESPAGPEETATQSAFADTLYQQLKASRIRVRHVKLDPRSGEKIPYDQLAEFDLVLLVGEFPKSVMAEMNTAGALYRESSPLTWEASSANSRQAGGTVVQTGEIHSARLSGQPVSAVYTGVVPIVYKAQRTLLDSLIQSTIWSFATITPLLMFVSRGFWAGLVTMLPNVLPVLVVFGGMGWLGIPIDIGSMMAASIALGVAVDDTIHYLTWFREDLHCSGNRHHAILMAYRRCATPTLQSALVNGLGLAVFAFSTFTPTKQFGYLMLTILIAGVVAELIMLPALLSGPLGKAFPIPRQGHSPGSEETETAILEPVLNGPHWSSVQEADTHHERKQKASIL